MPDNVFTTGNEICYQITSLIVDTLRANVSIPDSEIQQIVLDVRSDLSMIASLTCHTCPDATETDRPLYHCLQIPMLTISTIIKSLQKNNIDFSEAQLTLALEKHIDQIVGSFASLCPPSQTGQLTKEQYAKQNYKRENYFYRDIISELEQRMSGDKLPTSLIQALWTLWEKYFFGPEYLQKKQIEYNNLRTHTRDQINDALKIMRDYFLVDFQEKLEAYANNYVYSADTAPQNITEWLIDSLTPASTAKQFSNVNQEPYARQLVTVLAPNLNKHAESPF